ncbi:MAG: SGNH/GDSL hydrolase family protein [Clostridia bacterium]|nr:SGNH/GDSL hydrolase family protein [Clostridia bacterium]
MKLSSKTLKGLFKGALYFTEERGYLKAFRYNKSQLDYMADPSYDWGWRMRGRFTGGIRLEFKTDACKISFEYRASHSHERANTIDLYIDGRMVDVYKIGECLKGKVEYALPQGEKTVTIYLPNESELAIKNFQIDGRFKATKDKGKKLLIIGDSITQGAGPDFASGAYVHSLCRKTGMNIIAQGIGGYRYEPCDLMRVEGFDPDYIMVFLGTNYYEDCHRENGYDYALAVKEFYSKLNEIYPCVPVLCVTPLWRNNEGTDLERLAWCTNTIKNECARYPSIAVVDGFDLVPNVEECFADGIHPNAYGAEIIAENLAGIMREIF